MTAWYLLVDDAHDRMEDEYRPFANRYRAQGFRVYPTRSPREAVELLAAPQRSPGLAGAIVDFELGGRRVDRNRIRISVPGHDGTEYPVSTGVGVLDWIRTHEPDLPLWAVTDMSAVHAPIYLTSANLWADARPLTIDRFTTSHEVTDRLFAELSHPARAEALNPAWTQTASARRHFESLLEVEAGGVGALVWVRALAGIPSGLEAGFPKALSRAMESIVGRPVHADTTELVSAIAHWQQEFALLLGAFGLPVHWPNMTGAGNLSPWGDVNPFADFLGRNSECLEFLESVDVQRAFTRWRDSHPA